MNKIKKQDLSQRMRSAVSSAPTLNNRFAHAAARAELNPVLPASQPQEEATTQSTPVETIHATVPAAQATTAAPVLVAGGGVLREVPLDQIEPNPFNARHIYRPERVNELATSIGANGQETPGSAVAVGDKVILIAGHYRWKALKSLVHPMLLVVYPPMSDQELY